MVKIEYADSRYICPKSQKKDFELEMKRLFKKAKSDQYIGMICVGDLNPSVNNLDELVDKVNFTHYNKKYHFKKESVIDESLWKKCGKYKFTLREN